jgi:hypothetical protein
MQTRRLSWLLATSRAAPQAVPLARPEPAVDAQPEKDSTPHVQHDLFPEMGDADHEMLAPGAVEDYTHAVWIHQQRSHGPFRPAAAATGHGSGRLRGQRFRQKTRDRVAVQPQIVRRLHLVLPFQLPVGPKRSVLSRSGAYPCACSSEAVASTKFVGPQM